MFRIFLQKKVASDPKAAKKKKSKAPAKGPKNFSGKERRAFNRHSIEYKHLTLMNDQDILLIKDISLKGFSTEVSPRTAERMTVGDVFEAKIHYVGETLDLKIRVAWKSKNAIGFQITKAPEKTFEFLNRLIAPIEIAYSLSPVDSEAVASQEEGRTWYHSEKNCDLYTWHDEDTGILSAWWLIFQDNFIKWTNSSEGLITGQVIRGKEEKTAVGAPPSHNSTRYYTQNDPEIDEAKKKLALDIFMALDFPVREELLKTISN